MFAATLSLSSKTLFCAARRAMSSVMAARNEATLQELYMRAVEPKKPET